MKKEQGFTLLELLVVIGIIILLVAVLLPNIVSSSRMAKIKTTESEIKTIVVALQRYYTQFNDYPPTYLTKDCNGIESLVACLSTQSYGGPFLEWKESRYTNLDHDTAEANLTNWIFQDHELREIVDLWRSPFVYFHSRDYDTSCQYPLEEGGTFLAQPQRSKITSLFHKPNDYQLWSIGPDLKNENGEGDDIYNW